ncbi:MAG: hypothetical protein E7218_03415 [Anaerofustis stercorihominis]|nr:hypothetical protein [Anaerofustis stercorihominis]
MKKLKKTLLALILVSLAVCVVGTTLAWLTDDTEDVVNTFSPSNIDVKLEETPNTNTDGEDGNDAWFGKMVPGWKLDKDPKAWVEEGSEECYLFVKIGTNEGYSIEAKTDANDKVTYHIGNVANGEYIVYAVDSQWEAVPNTENVFYMVIDEESEMGEGENKYNILGAGTYVDPMGGTVDVTISWDDNQVATKPSVTEQMMEELEDPAKYPQLTFKAYAVQLWKTNKPAAGATDAEIEAAQFTPAEAWALAQQ